ncbi:hypothetical protein [Hymenobacter sp. BRD67]|uniref:hypothetical protein n=1 Tax=Hymenobacter sp. BRD67 TaxID=2675877 RepID=UPI0015637EA2|nr:hypothetical protein [Hymenobacter sp. BRD67]QKG52670.1 hypothetical protein GKZ67_08740 [Hymenobacter sp. BRD67]
MKKVYFIGAMLLSWLSAVPTWAQYTFTDTALQPYVQNFNTLSGSVAMSGNQLVSPAEVYTEATFPTGILDYTPTTIEANDGSNSVSNYYHFGYSSGATTDRAFGGIAGTSYSYDGTGYVGIRLKNGSSVTIKNLEVMYAMEQWYNSGKQDAARIDVSYQTGSAITSLLAGTWTPVPALGVNAPSTATVIASRDGNSATNRRVAATTLMGLNLAPGQEIMLRWGYALNSTTNGNGLSIDDVVVTPETGVFYSNTTGDLGLLANWDQSPWTTGQVTAASPPASFTADNQVFYVMSPAPRLRQITRTGFYRAPSPVMSLPGP